MAILGGDDGAQTYWFQSDAAVHYRQSNGTWQQQIAVDHRRGAVGNGIGINDNGFLVGLWPALAFDGTKAWLAYRDCHNGQSPIAGLGLVGSGDRLRRTGPPGPTEKGAPRSDASSERLGYGGHIQMVLVIGMPSLITDSIFGSPDGYGKDIYFTKRAANGTCKPLLRPRYADREQSARWVTLAYDTSFGYGMAVLDPRETTTFTLRTTAARPGASPTTSFRKGTAAGIPRWRSTRSTTTRRSPYTFARVPPGSQRSDSARRVRTRCGSATLISRKLEATKAMTQEGGTHLKLGLPSSGKG